MEMNEIAVQKSVIDRLKAAQKDEYEDVMKYDALAKEIGDPGSASILRDIADEEAAHAAFLEHILGRVHD